MRERFPDHSPLLQIVSLVRNLTGLDGKGQPSPYKAVIICEDKVLQWFADIAYESMLI